MGLLQLCCRNLPIQLDIVARTGSTNADVLARLGAGDSLLEGYWRIADRQVAGRGRQGRSWVGAPGNFMGSTLVHVVPTDPAPHTLSFVAALAVYHASAAVLGGDDGLLLKWPNDVLRNGVKFCGLLLERSGNSLVCGIGVNLSTVPAVEGRVVTALEGDGSVTSRDRFAKELAAQFAEQLELWRANGVTDLFSRWREHAHPEGAALSVHDGSGIKLHGHFAGLAPDGALRLKVEDGTVRVIHAGDVALEGN